MQEINTEAAVEAACCCYYCVLLLRAIVLRAKTVCLSFNRGGNGEGCMISYVLRVNLQTGCEVCLSTLYGALSVFFGAKLSFISILYIRLLLFVRTTTV